MPSTSRIVAGRTCDTHILIQLFFDFLIHYRKIFHPECTKVPVECWVVRIGCVCIFGGVLKSQLDETRSDHSAYLIQLRFGTRIALLWNFLNITLQCWYCGHRCRDEPIAGYCWLSLVIAGYRCRDEPIAGYCWLSLIIAGYR
jgi:hypothetical protein